MVKGWYFITVDLIIIYQILFNSAQFPRPVRAKSGIKD